MRSIPSSLLILFIGLLLCSGVFGQKRAQIGSVVEQVTVPLIVEGNRPFIDLTFRRADGSTRTARFLIDSGGGGFQITEPLARDIGLRWGATIRAEGAEFAKPTEIPKVYVGDFPLELNPNRVGISIGRDNVLPKTAPGHAEGMLPGHVIAQYFVVFDYPKGKFTLARANVLTPKGTPLPMPVGPQSGFPRTEIEVAGTKYAMLLDTGASFTMVSAAVLKSWGAAHPEWPRYQGAYGEAKTLGGQTLETMTLPGGLWGTHKLTEFGVTSQGEGVFEKYMSAMMAAPIVGSLAGNVLKHFRLELDYPNSKLYISGP
jgi:predicted aspartyl protease